MPQILEAIMVVTFGISWPVSIWKSYTARTAKGKSPVFLALILAGYICGMASKLATGGELPYTFWFYLANFVLVFCDLLLYFRNRRIDLQREADDASLGEP